MRALVEQVERKVSTILPDRFALVFDGQTTPEAHYVAVFATFPDKTETGFKEICLALSPMENEETQDANEHITFLHFVLSIFQKTMVNVVALIGDNCSVNQSISAKLGIPLIGCASHRFQLAVQEILKDYEVVIGEVNSLMVKLRTPILAAKLRRVTHLKAKLRNQTRWSSTFEMLKRHILLRDHLRQLHNEEIDDMLPNQAHERKIDSLFSKLSQLDEVTKKLQLSDASVRSARIYFDTVLEDYPFLFDRLNSNARIVHDPCFESGVLRIQEGQECDLKGDEKAAVSSLLLGGSVLNEGELGPQSIIERASKRLRTDGTLQPSAYMDTRFLLPTSNLCERFFSIAGYAMTNRRKGILPSNLEAQLFLFMNRDLWGINDIKNIVH